IQPVVPVWPAVILPMSCCIIIIERSGLGKYKGWCSRYHFIKYAQCLLFYLIHFHIKKPLTPFFPYHSVYNLWQACRKLVVACCGGIVHYHYLLVGIGFKGKYVNVVYYGY